MARDEDNQFVINTGGVVIDTGRAAFTTTATTAEVTTKLTRIYSVQLTPSNPTMADAETLFVVEAEADGGIVVPASGQVTIDRVVEGSGSITSGLDFYYTFIGY